jgi:hypothetical protein
MYFLGGRKIEYTVVHDASCLSSGDPQATTYDLVPAQTCLLIRIVQGFQRRSTSHDPFHFSASRRVGL